MKQECECTNECLGYLTKKCRRIEEPKIETLEEAPKEKLDFYQQGFADGIKIQQERIKDDIAYNKGFKDAVIKYRTI